MSKFYKNAVWKWLFVSIVVFLITGNGFAADTSWKKIKDKGELIVGFCAQYPPFESKNEKGGYEGFDVDLANAIGEKLKISVKFKDGEWQGLIPGMNKGDYDMLITCMGKTEARGKNVNFSDTYCNLTEVIVVRKNETVIKDRADLKGKVVGAQIATSSEQVVDSMADLFGEIKKYNYTTEAFLDLKFKRIDAVVCGLAYAIVQIGKDPSFKVVGKPLKSVEIVMVMPKNAHALTDRVNNALAAIKADGMYQKIYDTWLKVD